MSERIAEITLNVNTTGYSRRKDDVPYVRDAGAKCFVAEPADRVVRKINLWRQESVVCVFAVELRERRINLLSDSARLALLESSLSQRHAMTNEVTPLCKSSDIDIIRKAIYLQPWIDSPICGRKWIGCLSQRAHSLHPPLR